MAYPPTVPPNDRANGTTTFDEHPDDHNTIANALTDILAELGAAPKGSFADLTARLANVIRASSGLSSQLLQSKTESVTSNSDGFATITLPEVFASSDITVVANAQTSTATLVTISSRATNQFGIRLIDAGTGSPLGSTTRTIHWIAVGIKT